MPRVKLGYLYPIKHLCFLCAGSLTGIHCLLHKLNRVWSLDLPHNARLLSPQNNSSDVFPFFAALQIWMYLLCKNILLPTLKLPDWISAPCPFSSPEPNLTAFVPLILWVSLFPNFLTKNMLLSLHYFTHLIPLFTHYNFNTFHFSFVGFGLGVGIKKPCWHVFE